MEGWGGNLEPNGPLQSAHQFSWIGKATLHYTKIGEDQIFYCNQRGIGTEEAIALIVNGYCKDVLNQLPMEFAVEAQKLLAISLEGSVG